MDVPWWVFSAYKFSDNRGLNKSKQTENYIEWLTTIELTAKQGFKSVIALQASAAFLCSFLAIAPTILLVGKDKKSTNQEVKNEQANDNQTAIKRQANNKKRKEKQTKTSCSVECYTSGEDCRYS